MNPNTALESVIIKFVTADELLNSLGRWALLSVLTSYLLLLHPVKGWMPTTMEVSRQIMMMMMMITGLVDSKLYTSQ